jgi:hypothetical protein
MIGTLLSRGMLTLRTVVFWCMEQLFIYKDIFVPMKKPIHSMEPIDIEFLKFKEYLSSAVKVVERLGLTWLITFQCLYDPQLIL